MPGGKTIRGAIRLCAASILSVILLPYILRTYLALAPGADTQSVWLSFVQAVPFGDWLATLMISLWSEAQSGMDALTGWLTSSQIPFPIHLTVEMGKLVFSGVVLVVVTNFVGKKILLGSGGGFLNHAADVVFQVLCCFGATLLADVTYRFFESQLAQAGSTAQQVATVLFSIATGGGSLWILIVLNLVLLDAILAILLNCFKLLVTYSCFMWMLLSELQGGPDWLLPVGAALCLLVLWLVQRVEDVILPS